MSRWQIPSAWEWAQVGEIADVIGGGTPSASDPENFSDDGTPWITPADLSGYERTYVSRGARSLSAKGLATSSARVLPEGAVLFSSRAPIGYTVIAQNPIATNQGFKSLVLRQGIEPAYVRYYLLASRGYAESMASGSTFKELSGARMKELLVPVPPSSEQRRIVAKLDELLASSRAARAALDAVPALLQRYRQAVLAAAFRGELTTNWRERQRASAVALRDACAANDSGERERSHTEQADEVMPSLPRSWRYRCVEQLAAPGTVVTYGIILPGPEMEGGVPYVRQQDIEDGFIRLDDLRHTTRDIAARHERSSLKGGDVLLCIIRHLRVAIVPPELAGANITQGTVRIRPHREQVSPEYLAMYLSAPAAQAWMKQRYFGMAMPRINVRDAREVPVAVPPLAEQEEMVRQVSAQLASIDRQLAIVASLVDQADSLEGSILAKAFRGELVPQESSDEHASALLARLRAERTASPTHRPRRARARA